MLSEAKEPWWFFFVCSVVALPELILFGITYSPSLLNALSHGVSLSHDGVDHFEGYVCLLA